MVIKIGFSSMKGGVGKSTLSLVTASILHYDYGYPVTIIDCDDPQYSIVEMRKREASLVSKEESAQRRVQAFYESFDGGQLKVRAYTPDSTSSAFEDLLNNEVDQDGYVIVDFPGRWTEGATAFLALKMDYIISPIEPTVHSLQASVSFANSLQRLVTMEELKGRYSLNDVFLVWNKVKKQIPAHMRIMTGFESTVLPTLKAKLFNNVLYDSVRFGKEFGKSPDDEFLLSTLLPPAKFVRERTGIEEFITELITKCTK